MRASPCPLFPLHYVVDIDHAFWSPSILNYLVELSQFSLLLCLWESGTHISSLETRIQVSCPGSTSHTNLCETDWEAIMWRSKYDEETTFWPGWMWGRQTFKRTVVGKVLHLMFSKIGTTCCVRAHCRAAGKAWNRPVIWLWIIHKSEAFKPYSLSLSSPTDFGR